jgi:hypothetical protein
VKRRLRPALLGLALLCPLLGLAEAGEYPVRAVGTGPFGDLMLQAAREIARQPGFQERYPRSRYLLSGAAYYWMSGENCMAVAGFMIIDLADGSQTRSGNFSHADISEQGCPNAFVMQVVPGAQRQALRAFLGP